MKKIIDSDWLRAVQFFGKRVQKKRKSSAEKRKSNENLGILIGLETIEIVSANRIKAVAMQQKSHNYVEAVSNFKMAGFRLKSGFKSLKKTRFTS